MLMQASEQPMQNGFKFLVIKFPEVIEAPPVSKIAKSVAAASPSSLNVKTTVLRLLC